MHVALERSQYILNVVVFSVDVCVCVSFLYDLFSFIFQLVTLNKGYPLHFLQLLEFPKWYDRTLHSVINSLLDQSHHSSCLACIDFSF